MPQKPTSTLLGFVDDSYGNDNMWRTQAVLNVPVTGRFRARFGVDHGDRQGYMDNLSGVGPSEFNDIGYTQSFQCRLGHYAYSAEFDR